MNLNCPYCINFLQFLGANDLLAKVATNTHTVFIVCHPVERDMKDRGRQLEQILHQYMMYVKPAFEEFCLPVVTLAIQSI